MELNYGDIFGDKTGGRGKAADIPKGETDETGETLGGEGTEWLDKVNHIIEGINQLVVNYRELKGTVAGGNPSAMTSSGGSTGKAEIQQVVAETMLNFVNKTRESIGKSPLGKQKVGELMDMIKDLSVEQAFSLIMFGKGKSE